MSHVLADGGREVRDTPKLFRVNATDPTPCPPLSQKARRDQVLVWDKMKEATKTSLIKINNILAQYCSKPEQRHNP